MTSEIRSFKTPGRTLSFPRAMSMRFAITLSLLGRAISLRFHHTSQGLRLVFATQATLLVRLFCLVIGILRPCNLRLLMLGR